MRAVAVMGKLPRPGRVKTRLAQKIGGDRAAELYRAFLLDVFDVVDEAARIADREGLAFSRVFSCALGPEEPLSFARELAPSSWRVVAQRGEELGDRIEATRADALADRVVIIGSDAPTMRPERILSALRVLEAGEAPAVLGPTEDGGYDLIALSRPEPALLRGIPWSTPEVMAATRAAASAAGVRMVELELGYDLDEVSDLARALADPAPALRTKAAIGALFPYG
jgi:uncharacterized protein